MICCYKKAPRSALEKESRKVIDGLNVIEHPALCQGDEQGEVQMISNAGYLLTNLTRHLARKSDTTLPFMKGVMSYSRLERSFNGHNSEKIQGPTVSLPLDL